MAHVEFQKTHKVTLGFASQSVATTTTTGAFWSMESAHHAAVVFVIGAWTAAATISVIQGLAAGASPATIAGKALVLGAGHANSVQIIEVEASELNVASAYKTIAAKAVAAAAGAVIGATVIRHPLRVDPASYVT